LQGHQFGAPSSGTFSCRLRGAIFAKEIVIFDTSADWEISTAWRKGECAWKEQTFCSRGEIKYIQVAYTYLSTAFDMAASWLSRASPTLLMRKPNVCAKLIGRRLISSLSFHKLKRGGNLLSLTLCTYDTRMSEKSASLAITEHQYMFM